MKTMINLVGLLMLGAVITGCGVVYFPHDRGYHRGEYEHDRGRVMQKGPERGDHDRGREREREQYRKGDHGRDHKTDHKMDHQGDRDQRN